MEVEIRLAWHQSRGSFQGNERGKVEGVAFLLLVFLERLKTRTQKELSVFCLTKKTCISKEKGRSTQKKMMSHGIY